MPDTILIRDVANSISVELTSGEFEKLKKFVIGMGGVNILEKTSEGYVLSYHWRWIVPEITKSGKTALWEGGGGHTNTGYASIVASPSGEPMKPIYVRERGHRANSNHALFVVFPGCIYAVVGYRHWDTFDIAVWRLVEPIKAGRVTWGSFQHPNTEVYLARPEVYISENNLIVPNSLSTISRDAVRPLAAAIRKSYIYHCREPIFAKGYPLCDECSSVEKAMEYIKEKFEQTD